MEMKNINNIPAEKFRFANKSDNLHDKKLDTKAVSYFQDAFRRFCKNKGAVVGGVIIAFLVLFAMLAPLFTPFTPGYNDQMFAFAAPLNPLFLDLGIDFWDGCTEKTDVNYVTYMMHKALAQETGRDVIKNDEVVDNGDGTYSYRYNTYYGVGFGKYKTISKEEYEDIQRYQTETGRQVLYPIVRYGDRPTLEKNKYDANVYYVVQNRDAAVLRPKLDSEGNVIPNYWKYEAGTTTSSLMAEYDSQRIEGEDGVQENGKTYYYAYGRQVDGGIEVRAEYYEYYTYKHSLSEDDKIGEPIFYFGTTETGKDILACLSYGARFSFIFAILVAVSNLIMGVIWGSISGYYGGKIDIANMKENLAP